MTASVLHFPAPTPREGFTPRRVAAQDLPDIRRHLVAFQEHQAAHVAARHGSLPSDVQELSDGLAAAELFHISDEFCELAAAAHDSMPSHVLTRFDPPCERGLAMIADPSDTRTPRHLGDTAGWFWIVRTDGLRVGTVIDVDSDARFTEPAWAPYLYSVNESVVVKWGVSVDSMSDFGGSPEDVTAAGPMLWASNLIVFWNLLRQRGLASDTAVMPPRAVRRREQRAGREPSPVRVIALPGVRAASGEGSGGRDWRHRWVVRGHWRQQWYPSIQDHRPVWIAPHLKGPEDAPLLGGQKVYAVKAPPGEES